MFTIYAESIDYQTQHVTCNDKLLNDNNDDGTVFTVQCYTESHCQWDTLLSCKLLYSFFHI